MTDEAARAAAPVIGWSDAPVTTHRIATGISDAYPQLGCSAALTLTRLVRRHGGGPVPTTGKKAPFKRADMTALAEAGLVVLHGQSTVPVSTRVRSVRDYRASGGPGSGWTAATDNQAGEEKAKWGAGASAEGTALVNDQEATLSQDPSSANPAELPEEAAVRGVPIAETFEEVGLTLFGSAEVDTGRDDTRPARGLPEDAEDEADDEAEDEAEDEADDDSKDEGFDLGDLESVAALVFDIWHGGSELEWAQYAWSALGRAGLTAFTDEVDRTLVVCRLLVLAGLNREFAARAHEEGTPGEWHEHGTYDVVGDYPLIGEVALGRLAERLDVGEVGIPGWEMPTTQELVRDLVEHEWKTVANALKEELGDNFVFASLWLTSSGDGAYPPSGEAYDDAVNSDANDGGKQHAWSWIDQGMGPYGD